MKQISRTENAKAKTGTIKIDVPAKENYTAKQINIMLTNRNADVELFNSLKQLVVLLNDNRYYISDYCFEYLSNSFKEIEKLLNGDYNTPDDRADAYKDIEVCISHFDDAVTQAFIFRIIYASRHCTARQEYSSLKEDIKRQLRKLSRYSKEAD